MNRVMLSALVLSLFLLPGIAQAACSLGANPLSASARVVPGQIVEVTWNFYNLYGDRITHIKVSLAEGPDWEIVFDPELHEATYNVTGVLQTIEENVAVEPSSVVEVVPDPVPEGMDYVRHPSEDGYIPVRPVKIYVYVPEDAELWENYNFVFEAHGNCFTEPGAVIPSVATQLELSIRTISEEYWEEEVENVTETEREEAGIEEEREAEGEGITGFLVSNAPWIGVIVVLIALLVYVGFVRKPKIEEREGYSYTK